MADDISLRAVSGLPAIIVDKRTVASRVRRQVHIEARGFGSRGMDGTDAGGRWVGVGYTMSGRNTSHRKAQALSLLYGRSVKDLRYRRRSRSDMVMTTK